MYLACVFLAGLAYQRYSIKWLIAVLFIEIWVGRKTKNFRKTAGRSLILLSAFLLGIFHMRQEEDFRAAYMSKIIDGGRITIWGECIQIENTEYGIRGVLSDCYIRLDEETLPCNDIVVYTSEDQFQIGRIHKVNGKINMFSEARNEGNFDAFLYYQSLKIDFAVDAEEVYPLGEESQSLREKLFLFKERISKVYKASLNESAAGFYQAMVLGDKDNLEKRLKDLFLIGGISHILAISGLHVSIVGKGLYRVLRKQGVGFGAAGVSAGTLLIAYCVMAGSSVSTVRAVGMMFLFFIGNWLGRSYDMLNSLGALVLYLLWDNPFLVENSGFWFSVLAILGVGVVGKELSSKKGMGLGIGITLATLPITACSYYEIPIYSTLVNMIVLPLLSPVFLVAILGGLAGAFGVSTKLISIFLTPCEWLLRFYETICQVVAKLPGATVICGKLTIWQIVIYYVVLFGGVSMLQNFREKKKMQAMILLLCMSIIFFPKAKPFEITFLDVGQGDGIYISDGDGTSIFIDGGSSNVEVVGEYRILSFLKSKGVRKIDYWFVSHLDTDHISGLYEVISDGYEIGHIVVNELCSYSEKYYILRDLAEQKEIELLWMKTGDKVKTEKMEITCVGERNRLPREDENENSLVLQVKTDDFVALFAGDISEEMEKVLCESGILEEVDLFKANHHGSNYSNGEQLLETISPEYIVISCSKTNLYGHPGKNAVERMKACGAKVFYTMEDGQISFPLIQ